MILRIFIGFFLLITCQVSAQSDSSKILREDEFMNIVKSFHPIASQSNLQVKRAEAALKSSRGKFDPVLEAGMSSKELSAKDYYDYKNISVKIPTWYGIDLKVGTDVTNGVYADPERTSGTLNYAGVSVPLARNIITDKRRTLLQQAKNNINLSENERLIMVNDLLNDAMSAYWNWAIAYRQYSLLMQMSGVNKQRLDFVITSWKQGDRAAIDTTEAFAQYVYFRTRLSETLKSLNEARFELQLYMWLPNALPYDLNDKILPDTTVFTNFNNTLALPQLSPMLEVAMEQHPKLKRYNVLISNYQLDMKLKRQNLLPDVRLNYQFLQSGNTQFPTINSNKAGLTFELPLRFSEATGEFRESKLKITEADYQQKLIRKQIETKVRQYHNELEQLKVQIQQNEEMVNAYQLLLRAEEQKFRQGESALFIINNRETRLLEANQKLNELRGKYNKTLISFKWAGGVLVN